MSESAPPTPDIENKAHDKQPQGTVVEPKPSTTPQPNDFDANEPQPSLVAEFLDFLVHNKAWWLTPIILVLLLVGMLVVLAGTAAGPFIYTLF